MPIYAYRCDSCGHAKDVLQKISDPRLSVCPACGAPTFHKQVTAAGFQLKGSGWYVTDFRDKPAAAPATGAAAKPEGEGGGPAKTDGAAATAETKADKPGAPAPSAPVPAAPASAAPTPDKSAGKPTTSP